MALPYMQGQKRHRRFAGRPAPDNYDPVNGIPGDGVGAYEDHVSIVRGLESPTGGPTAVPKDKPFKMGGGA